MSEFSMTQDKLQVIATLMRGKFESKIDPLIDSCHSLEELDREIMPKIALYFKEFQSVTKYYDKILLDSGEELPEGFESGDIPDALTENDYRVQKCLMLKAVIGNRVLNHMRQIMESAKSLDEINSELTGALNWHNDLVDKLYRFYHYGPYDEENELSETESESKPRE